MSLSKYSIALGQMPADPEGRRAGAVIIYDGESGKELVRRSYDDVGDLLCAQTSPASSAGEVERLREALEGAMPTLEDDWEEAQEHADEAWCERAYARLKVARAALASDAGREGV